MQTLICEVQSRVHVLCNVAATVSTCVDDVLQGQDLREKGALCIDKQGSRNIAFFFKNM